MSSQLTYLWKEPHAPRNYRSAVSLHGHTHHSKEGLYFIWQYAKRNPILRLALASQTRLAKTKSDITADFASAHWKPPLSPLAALEVEREQIQHVLGLQPMISLTDHDDIEAPMLLRVLPKGRDVPISVEWTVPYNGATFHVGIHNLPPGRAETIFARLRQWTESPDPQRLHDLLQMLHDHRDVLVILNHPMWDLGGIGKEMHVDTLHRLVAQHGMFFHAFELGGVRSWEENQAVLEFAEAWGELVMGGGDRHGVEPSAFVNLTNAENFTDFVHEVREKRRSHVLVMPQYAEPFALRILQTLLDAIREYPEYPQGSRKWDERVFHHDRHGVLRPLSTLWDKPPVFIDLFFAAVRLLEITPIREVLRMMLAKPRKQMSFVSGRRQEGLSHARPTGRVLPMHVQRSRRRGEHQPAV